MTNLKKEAYLFEEQNKHSGSEVAQVYTIIHIGHTLDPLPHKYLLEEKKIPLAKKVVVKGDYEPYYELTS